MNKKNGKNFPALTKEQREIIIGISLGDAHLKTQTNGKTYNLHIEQSKKKEAYVYHLYDQFSSFVNLDTSPLEQAKDKGVTLSFTTLVHPSLRYYGQLFCRPETSMEGGEADDTCSTKQVPKNIHKYLSDRALAYWYMDDGALKGSNRSGKTLHTEGFTKQDVYILCAALNSKGIETRVNQQRRIYNGIKKTYYILYITAQGDPIFTNKIRKFIHPFFEYKLGTENNSELQEKT
jgi:hypothetical protein